MILVGALWGCTNPLLRQGSLADDEGMKPEDETDQSVAGSSSLWSTFKKFRNYRVLVPYAANQSGSLLYYFTLSRSDISLAVPICNGLALVFSIITSHICGERIENPVITILGSALVVLGVAICLVSKDSS